MPNDDQTLGDVRDLEIVRCPNCGARNSGGALVCLSCGVNLPAYQAAQARKRDANANRSRAQRDELEQTAAATVKQEVALRRRQLFLQLRILAGAAILLGLFIAGAAALYGYQLQLRNARLAAEYNNANQCLKNENFLCARDEFLNLLKEEPQYLDAATRLRDARYGLAGQYAQSGKWENGVVELDAILKVAPNDSAAIALLKDIYNRWYDDTITRGDWFAAGRVWFQRNARFPDGY